MSHWIVGDLQGCYEDFMRLMEAIRFDPAEDRLWIAGDLVNRGPASLETLRAVYALRDRVDCVLGNHDLHLLAEAAGVAPKSQPDLRPILDASDAHDWLAWLARRPLAIHLESFNTLIVHAGVHRDWTLDEVLHYSSMVETRLADHTRPAFLKSMYGNHPDQWSTQHHEADRLRLIVNCLTRMRFCRPDGSLDFAAKGHPTSEAAAALPWFALPDRRTRDTQIVFGHWSTLGTVQWPEHNVVGLDTGCVWGGSLTALRLEDGALVAVPCPLHRQPGS
ncbi:MAG: symmetrical bis(5'-nucleosyl)-tetraphosphatase [Pseudomonadota bacterium]|nr:symmetrical bis(5'-nucleosyl)-tetraphosphatase [Pseudomonadota bacterium]